ncbi:MAG: putative aldose-epimerase [Frankiales bacterium]|nr:putative aldose-epimerase [Frankiales bacterium]
MNPAAPIQLDLDGQQATVHTRGGRLERYRVDGRDVLAGTENPVMFAFRGALLAPWPNRVVGARWAWRGRELELPANEPATGSALHGLVFDAPWVVDQVDSCSIALSYALSARPGYPFPLQLTVTYELGAEGLTCGLTAVNIGTEPAPVGLGVHPYIAAPDLVDDLLLTIPARTVLETDASWRETGRLSVDAAGLDFRAARRLGDLALDVGFTDVITDGTGRSEVRVGRPDGRQVAVWSGPTCRWWMVYTADTLPSDDFRRSIAVEPMTCPPGALNTGQIDVVEPGGSLRLDWGVSLR